LKLVDQPVNLTVGNLWGNIWQLSWPIFLIMILNFFVGFTDIYVAGLINPEVQAAVGFVGQIYFLIIIAANAISIGTIAMVSRAVGSNDYQRALEISKQSLIFSAVIAIGLTIPGLFFPEEIISIAGFPPNIREISQTFLKIFSLALGPTYILIISNAVFRATGEVKKPLFTMFIVSVINIIGDFALVFGVFSFNGIGYMGIAFSTALASTIGMGINLLLFTLRRWRSLYTSPWSISSDTVKKIINLGWPAALVQFAWNAGSIVLYNILGRLGAASIPALASISNGLRIEAIIYLPAFALNMAASVLVGQNLGARNADRAEKLGWKIASSGVATTSLMALIIFTQAESFASLVTNDQAVLEDTTSYLKFNMLSEPFMALSAVLGGGLQGAGDTRGVMWVIIIAMWFIRLPLAYIFALILGYGATGVWAAMITSMMVQGVLMALRFHKGHWKKLKVD